MVDCQLEILEFLVIYNDVIGRQRNARPHRKSKLFVARLTSQAASLVALCENLYYPGAEQSALEIRTDFFFFLPLHGSRKL